MSTKRTRSLPSCEHLFVRSIGYTTTEHDPDKPWLILACEHRTVELEDPSMFFEWAAREWPAPRWSVQLDPWELSPSKR